MKKTVLLLGGLLPGEVETLMEHFNVLRLSRNQAAEAELKKHSRDIVALITTPMGKISRSTIDALPNLEIICQFGIGVDNIDVAYAKERGIAVTNTPDLVTEDTADIALALTLGVMRRLVEGDMYVRVGKWPNGPMGLGVSLGGKTVGILGMGRIGRAIAKRVTACGMKVIYHSRTKKDDLDYYFYDNIQSLASDSDILMICCSGGAETASLVDSAVLEALGDKGFLINIARGSVVNQEDLLVALRNKQIAGAGLDVFEHEPQVPEGLVSMDNVVLLPHIGTATIETRTRMGRLVIENLLAYFAGEPLKTAI